MTASTAGTDELIALPRAAGPMRLFANAGMPYPIISIALIFAWIVLAGSINALTGELAQAAEAGRLTRLCMAEMLQGALMVYLLTCEFVARREVAQDLGELRGEVELDDAHFEQVVARAFHETRLSVWLNVLGPMVACIAMVELDPALWMDRPKPAASSPIYLWAVARNTLMGWAGARLVVAEVRWTRAYVDLARNLRVPVPRGALSEPFVRKGLRSTAILLVFSSLFSLFWLGNSAGTMNPVLFTVTLAFTAYALFTPLSAFRSTVRLAKQSALARVDREIGAEHAPLLEGRSSDSARLASLIAWRGLVEEVDEWPLSAPAAFRVALFVLLGLGSWLGGALVERGVDALLE